MQIRLKQIDGVIDTASALQVPQWDAATAQYKPGRKNNVAAVDPTINDDSTAGYEENSMWVNTATNNVFICASPAVGAAVWVGIGVSGEPKRDENAGINIPAGSGDTVLPAPSQVPVSADSFNLYLNGVEQRQGPGKDYSITGATLQVITWLMPAPGTGVAGPMDVNDILTYKYETLST